MAEIAELARDDPALADAQAFHDGVIRTARPVVIRGLGTGLPAVAAADTVLDHLLAYDNGGRPELFLADAAIAGRYFYSDDLAGFNFRRAQLPLAEAFGHIRRHAAEPSAPTAYLGSLVASAYLPGFAEANRLGVVPPEVETRLWIGNASHVACHYDAYENLACVIAGARRFTLYPPDAIADLYVGPIDHTMAGQPASLASADPERFPRFATAKARAVTVDLVPGDALFLPKLWWHEVEATGPINVMLNHWWDATATGPDAPMLTMLFAMIALAERPEAERMAFRAFFDHYVFRPEGHPLAHLPEEQRGVLRDLTGPRYGQIRAMVLRALRGG